MRHTDEDPAAEDEARDLERLDVDLEMAEMTAYGDAMAAAWRAGRCTHGSSQGYRGGPRSAQQAGLEPGQVRCTATTPFPGGCGAVFGSDEEWLAAMDAAVAGE